MNNNTQNNILNNTMNNTLNSTQNNILNETQDENNLNNINKDLIN